VGHSAYLCVGESVRECDNLFVNRICVCECVCACVCACVCVCV